MKLKIEELKAALKRLPDWQLAQDREAITRKFQFADFDAAFAFMGLHESQHLARRALLGLEGELEVRPVEAAHERPGRRREQLVDDVAAGRRIGAHFVRRAVIGQRGEPAGIAGDVCPWFARSRPWCNNPAVWLVFFRQARSCIFNQQEVNPHE